MACLTPLAHTHRLSLKSGVKTIKIKPPRRERVQLSSGVVLFIKKI